MNHTSKLAIQNSTIINALKLGLLLVCAIDIVGCTKKTPIANSSPSTVEAEKADCIMAYILDQASPIASELCSGIIPGFGKEFNSVFKKFHTVNAQKISRGKILSDEEEADVKKKFPNSKYSNLSISDMQAEFVRSFQQISIAEQNSYCEKHLMFIKKYTEFH